MYNKTEKYKTDFLLPKNNFLVGLGSIFNLAGSYFEYKYSRSEQEADRKALMSDWFNVGNDIKLSKEKFEKEHSKELCL